MVTQVVCPSESYLSSRTAWAGLVDVPLYEDGAFNSEATQRRDELAEQVYAAARAQLGSQ